VQRRGAAARRAAAHLIRTHTHGGYATHWRPTRADSAPAAGFSARVQCQRVQSGYVQQLARWLCCVGCDRAGETDLVHCGLWAAKHAPWVAPASRTTRQAAQAGPWTVIPVPWASSTPVCNAPAPRYSCASFWYRVLRCVAERQTSDRPPARERARGLKASGMAHQ